MKLLKKDETIITSANGAVRFAMERAINPTDWPQIIHLDENNTPLPRNQGGGAGLIVVEKRAGDPTPTDNDIKKAEATKMACDQIDRRFVDYIILGTGCFYSFADERVKKIGDGGIVRFIPKSISLHKRVR